jgi:hypothetical protein
VIKEWCYWEHIDWKLGEKMENLENIIGEHAKNTLLRNMVGKPK